MFIGIMRSTLVSSIPIYRYKTLREGHIYLLPERALMINKTETKKQDEIGS
ncbi:hypothetical protein SVI_1687 [Shewanella violacea DSS12]|uniref:Uncharacterized protein n=1 Tax=Shewanella violacea (strain JCM 10179 / CIP 106290 / LMG 19151 / DSS12) TaxID=637905 RepID=D4ZJ09_SHEVD|nr:hypothetical protein SVI_1687 [Shewanella violacea DSS12]